MGFARCFGRSKKNNPRISPKLSKRSLSRLSSFERLPEGLSPSAPSYDSRMHTHSSESMARRSQSGDSITPKGRKGREAKVERRHSLEPLAENHQVSMSGSYCGPPSPSSPPPLQLKTNPRSISNLSKTSASSTSSRLSNALPASLRPLSRTRRSNSVPSFPRRKHSRDVITDTTHRWVFESKAISLCDFLSELPSDYGASQPPLRETTSMSNLEHPTLSVASSVDTLATQPPAPPDAPMPTSPPPGAALQPSIQIDMSCLEEVIRDKEANAVYSDFSKLLLSPVGLKGFRKFLITSHCAENLDFYLSVARALKQRESCADGPGPTPRTGRDSGSNGMGSLQGVASPAPGSIGLAPELHDLEAIYDEYVVETAPRAVNIQGARRKAIREELLRIGPGRAANKENLGISMFPAIASDTIVGAFRSAQREIGHLMKTDNFPRFLESEFAREWKAQCFEAVDEVSRIEAERQKRDVAMESK